MNSAAPSLEIDLKPVSSGRKGRKCLVRLARFAIGLVILIYLFSIIPIEQVGQVLARADWVWVAGACGLSLVVQALAARRLKILADVHDLGLTDKQIFIVNLSTRFYGLFLPGGGFTAIAVRVFRLVEVRNHIVGALAAVTVDRLLATMAMCLIGILFWFAAWPTPKWPWLVMLVGAFLALLLPLLTVLLWQPRLARGRFRISSGILKKPYEALRLAVSELRAMTSADKRQVIMLSIFANLVGVVEVIAIAVALDVEIDVMTIAWVRSAILVAALPPVSLSGLGVREGAALLVLSGYGIQGEEAIAFSLLVFAVGSLFIGLVGGLTEGWRWLSVRY